MKPSAMLEFVLLAALWGGSFIFIRVSVHDFGPIALAEMRVIIAAVCLLPLAAWRGETQALKSNWGHLIVCGVLSYGLPFALISYGLLTLSAGLSSIFNATTPLWGAFVAWVWLGDRLSSSRIVGLLVGFAGVLWLALSKVNLAASNSGHETALAIAAILAGTLSYAIGVSYTKRFLSHVPPLAVAAGSQVGGILALAVPAAMNWPEVSPSGTAWAAVLLLGLLSTALAYTIFYHLVETAGPANALATTFLVPAFAVLWGSLLFHEELTPQMVVGCAVIVSGTVLAVGLVQGSRIGRMLGMGQRA